MHHIQNLNIFSSNNLPAQQLNFLIVRILATAVVTEMSKVEESLVYMQFIKICKKKYLTLEIQ